MLLQAAAMLKEEASNLHFVIMGYPGVDSYRELANYMGLSDRVTFTGRIPYHDAPRYLALGDIAVSPKMSKTEGAGKIGNYMAMGLPTVAFETPVSREIMGDLGVYAKYGNARSLADCIKRVADDEQLRETLGNKVRGKAVAEMGWDQGLQQLEEIYEQILGKRLRSGLPGVEPENPAKFAADSSAEPVDEVEQKHGRRVYFNS
jgi:glycosyltransferase involved in cell wall biosynthesis